MTTTNKQPISLLEQTKAAMNKYIANINDDYGRPEYLLYTFYRNIELFATDGVDMAAHKIEMLMRSFMNPEVSAAVTKQFGAHSLEDMADCLAHLHWLFTNMDQPKAKAYIDREWLETLNSDKEADLSHIKQLFVEYATLNELEQHKVAIEEKYKAMAA